MKKLSTILILFIASLYIQAQDNTIENEKISKNDIEEDLKGLEIKDLIKSPERIKRDSIENACRLANDSIDMAAYRLIRNDLDINLLTDSVNGGDIQIIESSDKKIRTIRWVMRMPDSTKLNRYIVQYYLAPNKMRTYSDYRYSQFRQGYTVFGRANQFDSMRVKAIYTLRHGIYLIEAYTSTEQKIFAVDISRGLMNDAYIFRNEERNQPECEIVHANYDSDRKYYKIDGQNLIKPDGSILRFNGSHYEDEELYLSRFEDPKIGDTPYITSLYYKRVRDGKPTTSTSIGEELILMLDAAYKGDALAKDSIYAVGMTSSEDHEHVDAKRIDISMPLRSMSNRIFVEAFNFYYLPVDSILGNAPLTKVINSAGRKSAYTYETLRYSALVFDRQQTSEDDYKRIRWAVKVDDIEETLDPAKYWGTQIDLVMKEEWTGQTIVVTPYIEGCTINREVSIETDVRSW